MSQEAFEPVISRPYISQLERGLKSPTLEKVEHLAKQMRVHPLTLLTLAYSKSMRTDDVRRTLESVTAEIADIRENSADGVSATSGRRLR
jgi:transcriptional regulator with XRE-family HTH domain